MRQVELTDRQFAVYYFIALSISRGMPPTRAEIQHHFGWKSPNAAEDHLRALERKGVIRLIPAISRGIEIVHNDKAPSRMAEGLEGLDRED
jgi:repressor LexA